MAEGLNDEAAARRAEGPTPEETHTLAVLAVWVSRDIAQGHHKDTATGIEVLVRYALDVDRGHGPEAMKRWERAACVRDHIALVLDALEQKGARQ